MMKKEDFITTSPQETSVPYMPTHFPRVLIVSHCPLSDSQSNGKTMTGLFRSWDAENLAQLYFRNALPDHSICRKFFRITDSEMLKRSLMQRGVQGQLIGADYPNLQPAADTSANPISLKQPPPFFRLIRDLVWKLGNFKTKQLQTFLDDFHPEIVFFQGSSQVFAFSVVKWVCETYKVPLIMQCTDDYVTQRATADPFAILHCARLTDQFRWAVSYSSCIIAIGEKMAGEYKARFGGTYYVAMNVVDKVELPETVPGETIRLLYAGNLGLNRWKVLGLISDCLRELFDEEGIKGELQICSLSPPKGDELKLLHRPPFSLYKGSLNGKQLNEAKTRSDLLVHVEAFDKRNRHLTRLSISTKIPEYLASRRCIFAVGPANVASMQYIADHDLGVAVLSDVKVDIKNALREIMTDPVKRALYADRGVEVAARRHDRQSTAKDIYRIIERSVTPSSRRAIKGNI